VARVVNIDHISVRVSDFARSKAFYSKLFAFLGFKVLGEHDDAVGWTNGKSRYWIGQADAQSGKHKYRIGDVGLHHLGFELRSRKDVDALQAFVKKLGATIVDPAGEYYDDYYAVFFLDPDGLKLEGMKWGEKTEQAKRKRAAAKQPKAKPKSRRSAG
jgi:catechol 2,3-dioxygenase-like lactoylglutathione lyase family enzyme